MSDDAPSFEKGKDGGLWLPAWFLKFICWVVSIVSTGLISWAVFVTIFLFELDKKVDRTSDLEDRIKAAETGLALTRERMILNEQVVSELNRRVSVLEAKVDK